MMKETSQKVCNLCGKPVEVWDQSGFNFHGRMGYGSRYDGDLISLVLCCECTDKLVESCLISPIIEDDT